MPPRKKSTSGHTPVEALTHDDKRVNLPTADAESLVEAALKDAITVRYARNPDLDPQLVWKGKDEQDGVPLEVAAPPLFIQEKIDPRVLIENLRRTAARKDDEPELTLFETFDGLDDFESVEYYKHAANWSNRLILGDSLEVMASLAERENLRGQVQMIYMDPPYGISFASNWQARVRSTQVKNTFADATREVEQIRAFRDTWELGIHSYLSYMRDRLVVARDLLTESGGVFVQIGDENVHLVRALLDEVFGAENFAVQFSFRTKIPLRTTLVPQVYDHILWYAKSLPNLKFRRLFTERVTDETSQFGMVRESDGTNRRLTPDEAAGTDLPRGARLFTGVDLVSAGRTESCVFEFEFQGRKFFPGSGKSWKTNREGIEKLIAADRLVALGSVPRYVFFADDYPVSELTNVWTDTQGAVGRTYVVQTATKVVQRCVLMATDPGDLVLDPTCGSGTTAVVSEHWGRRWITVDTSRVALSLARTRLVGSRFPSFVLRDDAPSETEVPSSSRGYVGSRAWPDVRKGFVYRSVPHVTLGSITRNPRISTSMSVDEIEEEVRASAEMEVLYDQPLEVSGRVRVSGPMTVESLAPHRSGVMPAAAPKSEAVPTDDPAQASFEEMLLDNLRESGVQSGRKDRRLAFDSVKPVAGRYLLAEMVPSEVGLVRERIAVTIGPRYGVVGADWIKGAAREATKGAGFDVLLVLAFAFDPHALEAVQEIHDDSDGFAVQGEREIGGLRVLLVRMNADLAMGEKLLKKSKNANLFTVFGEPDVVTRHTKDGWVVEVKGFDIYNPVTGEVESGDADDIAMWMLDTDYDEQSFFVRHAYFPGRQDPYTKLKKALKADIDEAAWDTLNSTTSRPFPAPSTGKVAVKVINDYGDEVITVLDVSGGDPEGRSGSSSHEHPRGKQPADEEPEPAGHPEGTVGYLEERIAEVEGFYVRVCHPDGAKVRGDKRVDVDYSYVNRAQATYSVSDWVHGRFEKVLPDYRVQVLFGDGTVAHGNTRLTTVRESYE